MAFQMSHSLARLFLNFQAHGSVTDHVVDFFFLFGGTATLPCNANKSPPPASSRSSLFCPPPPLGTFPAPWMKSWKVTSDRGTMPELVRFPLSQNGPSLGM
ncbi:hypothetical protein ASPTUDRAFT_569970 [Aspergillus tubingensis CBS 134.48]|uniref:Uncharacterized protein n=1 Tax=Aspergillus tubingensis (strain CBS 134.48) TaxID=767770 RepID=A0A1L9N7K7_ASPTC|nr:hypothetical protein ASPTUDRAFT_569970 [Aspergillus tubingensis CBS 134.48]